MTYPIEFREKVISYILEGGSKTSASKIYKISLNALNVKVMTLFTWMRLAFLLEHQEAMAIHRKGSEFMALLDNNELNRTSEM